MNKTHLIDIIATTMNASKAEAKRCIESFFDVIKDGIRKDESLRLSEFGTFRLVQRKERRAKSPRTGEDIMIPASRTITFKAGKTLKNSLS